MKVWRADFPGDDTNVTSLSAKPASVHLAKWLRSQESRTGSSLANADVSPSAGTPTFLTRISARISPLPFLPAKLGAQSMSNNRSRSRVKVWWESWKKMWKMRARKITLIFFLKFQTLFKPTILTLKLDHSMFSWCLRLAWFGLLTTGFHMFRTSSQCALVPKAAPLMAAWSQQTEQMHTEKLFCVSCTC